jgi:hypothetical protein
MLVDVIWFRHDATLQPKVTADAEPPR